MNSKNKICPYCNSKFSIRKHLVECNPGVSLEDSYVAMLQLNYNFNISDLILDYTEYFFSLPDLKEKYGISYRTSLEILNIMGIEKRNISESTKCERTNNKKKQSFIRIYGVDNPSKSDHIKEKKKETFIKNYKVDNIYKTEEFKKYLDDLMIRKYGCLRKTNPKKISNSRNEFTKDKWDSIDKKIKATSLERYGVDNVSKLDKNKSASSKYMKEFWNNLSDIEKEEMFKKNLKLVSKQEMKVRNILDSNSIMYTPQRFINGKSYDILLNFTNIVVEINGDYWHANPEKYLQDDEISYPNIGKIKASSVWERDRKKKENAEKYGYKVIYIWESEINRAKKNGNLDFFILNKIYENTKDKIN